MADGRDCTCGSGAHPRRCLKHPDAYRAHVADLQAEARRAESDLHAAAHRTAAAAATAEYQRVFAAEIARAEARS